MGEAKRRGTFEQRKAEAIELKARFIQAMRQQQLMRGKTVTGRTPSQPEVQELDISKEWLRNKLEACDDSSVSAGNIPHPTKKKPPIDPDRVWYDEAGEVPQDAWDSLVSVAADSNGGSNGPQGS